MNIQTIIMSRQVRIARHDYLSTCDQISILIPLPLNPLSCRLTSVAIMPPKDTLAPVAYMPPKDTLASVILLNAS